VKTSVLTANGLVSSILRIHEVQKSWQF